MTDDASERGSVVRLRVEPDEAGVRLDRWLKRRFPGLGQGRIQKWLRIGQVRIDGGRVKAGARLEAGQEVRIPPVSAASLLPDVRPETSRPPRPVRPDEAEDLRRRVLHRDAEVIVIDKPAGLAVQGGTGTDRHLDGMLDALTFDARERPRLVHRLDRDTSGILVLARSAAAASKLTAAFRDKTARKIYWALVVGVPGAREGRIGLALAKRSGQYGERVVADEAGKTAITRYRVIDQVSKRCAWLALEPLTGRTHQLRAHCMAMGTPIVGDGKYGGRASFLKGLDSARMLHLHARAIRIPHPDGGILEVQAQLPDSLRQTWTYLGFDLTIENDLFAGRK